MRRPYESPSSLGMYLRCPQQYAFKYRDKLPWPDSKAAELGRRFGELVYTTWGKTKLHGTDFKIEDDVMEDGENQKLTAMINAFYKHPSVAEIPKFDLKYGVDCEREVIVPVQGGYLSKGYIDLVIPDYAAIDIKTSKRRWTSKNIEEGLQHLKYIYALRKLGIHLDRFIYILVTTTKSPSVQFMDLKISDEALAAFEAKFIDTVSRIELELFHPTPSKDCYWCPYKDRCPAWR